MSEDPGERAKKYVANFEKALKETKLVNVGDAGVKEADVRGIWDTIDRYLRDAGYYLEQGKPTTSLVSIAYAEGLLDALTFLKLAETKPLK